MLSRFKVTLALALGIAVVSLLPGESLPQFSWGQMISLDTLGHFGLYALLSFVFLYEWLRNQRSVRGQLSDSIRIWASTSVFGILLEVLQATMITGRFFEVSDIIANIIGSMTGILMYFWLMKN